MYIIKGKITKQKQLKMFSIIQKMLKEAHENSLKNKEIYLESMLDSLKSNTYEKKDQ